MIIPFQLVMASYFPHVLCPFSMFFSLSLLFQYYILIYESAIRAITVFRMRNMPMDLGMLF